MLWDLKIYRYAHFVEFSGSMNIAMRPQKNSKHTETL